MITSCFIVLLTLSQVSGWCVTTHENFFSDSKCTTIVAASSLTRSFDKGCLKTSYASSMKVNCKSMTTIDYEFFTNEDCFGYRSSVLSYPY